MVYFVGAGAGDPELLTIKGKRLIDHADVLIYAGSLVNPEVLADRKPESIVYDSAGMTLEEVLAVMKQAEQAGKTTVRVHTGDASIYGAIREQLDALDRMGIAHEVVPGVSSFLAAAAALQKEYTLPDVSQTVILTRMAGARTNRIAGSPSSNDGDFPIRWTDCGVGAAVVYLLSFANAGCGSLQSKLARSEACNRNAGNDCRAGASCWHSEDCIGIGWGIFGGYLRSLEAL